MVGGTGPAADDGGPPPRARLRARSRRTAERTIRVTTTSMTSTNRVNTAANTLVSPDRGGGAPGHRAVSPSSCQVTGPSSPDGRRLAPFPRFMRPADLALARRTGRSVLAVPAWLLAWSSQAGGRQTAVFGIGAIGGELQRREGAGAGPDAPKGARRRPSARLEAGKALITPYDVGRDDFPTRAPAGAWFGFARWSSEPLSGQPPPGSRVFDYSVGPPPFSGAHIVPRRPRASATPADKFHASGARRPRQPAAPGGRQPAAPWAPVRRSGPPGHATAPPRPRPAPP